MANDKQLDYIREQLSSIEAGQTYTYFTNAKFSSYHVLQFLLEYTGAADVFITSFSISEQSLVALRKLQKAEQIKQVKFILNNQTRQYFSDLMPLCRSVGDIRFTNVHMKIIIVSGQNHMAVVNTSGNFSVSKSIESGTLSTDAKIFDLYYSQFDRLWSSPKNNSKN